MSQGIQSKGASLLNARYSMFNAHSQIRATPTFSLASVLTSPSPQMLLSDYKPVFVCAFSNPLTWNMQTCIDCTCLKFPHCVCSVHCLIFLTSTALLWPQHSFMTMKLPQNYFRTRILVFSLEGLLFFWTVSTFETIQMVSRVCSEDYRLHQVARFCFIPAALSLLQQKSLLHRMNDFATHVHFLPLSENKTIVSISPSF